LVATPDQESFPSWTFIPVVAKCEILTKVHRNWIWANGYFGLPA
jgi:hypothetical protein